MKIEKKFFNNKVILIKLELHKDNRGFFSESYNKIKLSKFGISKNFVQDNFSFSKKKYTFRGVHLQLKPFQQAKLLKVINGEIIDFVVDLRKNSKSFGSHIKIKMNKNDNNILYIPEGFGHAFLTLKNDTIISYKVSNYYSPNHSMTICYNDKNIDLGMNNKIINKLILSKNDLNGITLLDLKKK